MDMFIALAATQIATVYGYGEHMCGEVGRPRPCDHRATTATGEPFKPMEITAAVPAPKKKLISTTVVWVKNYKGACIPIKINDKKNARYVGNGGLDLTPGAVWAITGKLPNRFWSGKIELCRNEVQSCSSTSLPCTAPTH